jgi:hypothetical protein
MSKARNQHWLPQFYLRYFAVPGYRNKKNAKIWLTDIDADEVSEEKVREVAASEFLYSHLKADGTRSYHVEDKLARLESTIARLYPRIAEGYPDLSVAWGIKKFSAVFIASLMLRHPSMEQETRDMHRKMVDACEQMPKDEDGLPQISHLIHKGQALKFDTSDYHEYKAADENRLKQMFAEQIQPLAIDLSDKLFKKRWAFLCTESPAFFTSDKPVIKQHTERSTFGIGTPGVNLWFPVSPNRMLWMTDRNGDEPDGFYPLPMDEAIPLNMFTMGHAPKFLLSHEHPDIALRKLDSYLNEAIRSLSTG